jgi:phosphatidylglycerol:prolipoprotein diacylglycerol transferase
MIDINRFLSPEIMHLGGPVSVHTYGFMISLGFLVLVHLANRDPRRGKILSKETFTNALLSGLIVGVIGGRVLHLIEYPAEVQANWLHAFYVWNGGLSVLGSVCAILLVMPLYLRFKKIPIIPLFDLAATYAPLMQSIARIGCLAAGCCYGTHTVAPWSIFYTHPSSFAPLFKQLHPTQLYHSFASLCIFLILYFFARTQKPRNGIIISLYLILESAARFSVDFWRADREIFKYSLSFDQWVALGVMCFGLIAMSYTLYDSNNTTPPKKRVRS